MMPMMDGAKSHPQVISNRLAAWPPVDDTFESGYGAHAARSIARSAIRQDPNTSIAARAIRLKTGNMHAAVPNYTPEDMSPEAIGRRLTLVRRAFGFEKSEFADLLGIERPAWSRFENGKRAIPYEQASKIVRRFGVSLDFIVLGRIAGMEFEVLERLRQAGLE